MDVLVGEHSYGVAAGPHLVNGLAVGIAAMAQSTGVVPKQDWIYSQNVIALRIIKMPFECNIIKVR